MHAWHKIYSKALHELGCKLKVSHSAFFTWMSLLGKMMVNTDLDDGIGVSSSVEDCNTFLSTLESCFKIKAQTDQQNHVMLGLSINLREDETKLSIKVYIDKIIQQFLGLISDSYSMPMDSYVMLSQSMCPVIIKGVGDDEISTVRFTIESMKDRPFRLMLGACSWMANICRLDITYILQFMSYSTIKQFLILITGQCLLDFVDISKKPTTSALSLRTVVLRI